jgi:hypothetical protein
MLKLPKRDMSSFGSVRLTIETSTEEIFGGYERLLSLFDNSSEQPQNKLRSLTAVEGSFISPRDPITMATAMLSAVYLLLSEGM